MCLAIPGKVEQITEGDIRMGRVNFGGVVKNVCLDYVPEVVVGDYTIVHVGFALSKIDEATALETLELFEKMGALQEELASEEEVFARAANVPQSPCPDGSCDLTGKDLRSQELSIGGKKVKYLTEFRNGEIAQRMAREIHQVATRPWKIMEVCGGQTHSIIRNGIDQMLPAGIEMIHGPGCPVCVTPLGLIDKALAIAAQPGVIFCSFGDMLRVPGTDRDLFQVKGEGGDVRVVYSPLDAVELAVKNPDKQVVFFGVGFETTAPANAMSVHLARRRGIKNFSVLVSHVLVPPAIEAIMSSPDNKVQAFLAAGHVCSVMGYWEYPPIADRFEIPIVVTGFEPLDLLDGIRRAVIQLEKGEHHVENAYERIVTYAGNLPAQQLLAEVFEVADRAWRGIGVIPKSGWRLSEPYRAFDAEERFQISGIHTEESPLCKAGDVLRGAIKPAECPAFGKECTPRHPLGATMVSSEGACAAYFNYGRFLSAEDLAHAGSALSGAVNA